MGYYRWSSKTEDSRKEMGTVLKTNRELSHVCFLNVLQRVCIPCMIRKIEKQPQNCYFKKKPIQQLCAELNAKFQPTSGVSGVWFLAGSPTLSQTLLRRWFYLPPSQVWIFQCPPDKRSDGVPDNHNERTQLLQLQPQPTLLCSWNLWTGTERVTKHIATRQEAKDDF